jgi:hypothetical protein
MSNPTQPGWQKGSWREEFRSRGSEIEAALRTAPSIAAAYRQVPGLRMSEWQFRRYVERFLPDLHARFVGRSQRQSVSEGKRSVIEGPPRPPSQNSDKRRFVTARLRTTGEKGDA